MRQYELTIRIAQIHHLIEVRKYKKALAVVKTLDMRQVKGISDLSAIAEVYTKTEQFDAAKNTYLRIYKKSRTRRVLYRLIYLAIRTNALDEAEGYYQEFVAMSSSQRDSLILRYRIDKASGASVGQLIGILESLKEEEYIEEWAYELAKLYFKAGRFEECRSECEDIKLWFGKGEIVERAYELAKLYFKAGRFEECRSECEDIKLWFGKGEIVERAKRLIASIDDDEQIAYVDDRDYTIEKEVPNPEDTGSLPDLSEYVESESVIQRRENSIGNKVKKALKTTFEDDEDKFDDTFADYYEDEDESSEYGRDEAVDELLNMDGDNNLEKSSGDKMESLTKEEYDALLNSEILEQSYNDEQSEYENELYDYGEDEEEEFDGAQMARKAIDGLQKLSGRWKHQTAKEQHTSEQSEYGEDSVDENKKQPHKKNRNQQMEKKQAYAEEKAPYEHHSQSGTGITQDLSKEISAIYEAERREQLKVHSVVMEDDIDNGNDDLIQQNTENGEAASSEIPEDIQESEENAVISRQDAMAPADLEEIKNDIKDITGNIFGEKKKRRIIDSVADDWGHTKPINETVSKVREMEMQQDNDSLSDESVKKNVEYSEKSDTRFVLDNGAEPEININGKSECIQKNDENKSEVQPGVNNEVKSETEIKLEKAAKLFGINTSELKKEETNMDDYSTPEDELPTTRALHKTFKDVLTLINGEKDPSHFVLIGEDTDKIIAVSKKIVKVLKANGFLSKGRIGCIQAKQLNQMDFDACRDQLKGSCLLVDGAADLYFPTITKIFELMDEFYGDFIVILADEGNTLDQMFRFAPALAKKFKYVIDINRYTAEDLD